MYTLLVLRLVGTGSDDFGAALLSLHDVDGDGLDDLVVGAPGDDTVGTDAGAVYVYPGATAGYVDQAAVAVIYGATAGDGFGSTLAAGDVDGDGAAELAVGGSGCDCVTVVRAADAYATRQTWSGVGADDFGAALDFGDLDGDGHVDLLIGAPGDDTAGVDAGAAFVVPGSPDGLAADPTTALYGTDAGAAFGTAVIGGGDANGDGIDELVVSAPEGWTAGRGVVQAWYGAAAGLSASADWELTGDPGFGTTLVRIDSDADGYDDVAVASETLGAGGIEVYPGGAGGYGTVRSWRASSGVDSADLGDVEVAPAADADGDGVEDLPYWEYYSFTDPCSSGKGFGGGYGADMHVPPYRLAPAGDVDPDGIQELWVAASERVELLVNTPDADDDGFPATSAEGLTDCDDGSAAIHPAARETQRDGVDSNCDGVDDPSAAGRTRTCRQVDSLVQAKAMVDDGSAMASDVVAWSDEALDVLAASGQAYTIGGGETAHSWWLGALDAGPSVAGRRIYTRDAWSSSYYDTHDHCVMESVEIERSAVDLRWDEPTPGGLVGFLGSSSGTSSLSGESGGLSGTAWFADGAYTDFYVYTYDWRDVDEDDYSGVDEEGLKEEADGCTWTYTAKTEYPEETYHAVFDDGTHHLEVAEYDGAADCPTSRLIGKVDEGPWLPIDRDWVVYTGTDVDGDGWPTGHGDCNDADPDVNPCAVETPGCEDRNCDGQDEDSDRDGADDCADCDPEDATVGARAGWYGGPDLDGDGYGATWLGELCAPPPEGATAVPDCDDTDPLVSPHGLEDCNGVDDDCDGELDERSSGTRYRDIDHDGYGDGVHLVPEEWPCSGGPAGDCDDYNTGRHPGATEVAGDGIDQDCDGADKHKAPGSAAPDCGCTGQLGAFVPLGALAVLLRRSRRHRHSR